MEQSISLTKTTPTEEHARLLLMLFTRQGIDAIEDQMQQMENRPESVKKFNEARNDVNVVLAEHHLSLQDAFLVAVQILAEVMGQISEAANESSQQG